MADPFTILLKWDDGVHTVIDTPPEAARSREIVYYQGTFFTYSHYEFQTETLVFEQAATPIDLTHDTHYRDLYVPL